MWRIWLWAPSLWWDLGALIATTSLLRWNLGVKGWVAWRMGMLSFAGGNLPIFLLVVAILALS